MAYKHSFCQGALFTLTTPPAHDPLSFLLGGRDARLEVDVWMRDGAMAPMVLAAGTAKAVRALAKGNADVKDFAPRVEAPGRDRMPHWPRGAAGSGEREFVAHAEAPALLADLFGDARVQQLLGRCPDVFRLLRSALFTTEGSLGGGGGGGRLLFTFTLPPAGSLKELAPCLELAYLMIDVVGTYKPSADAQAKAAALRERVGAARAAAARRGDGGEGGGGGGAHEERQQAAMARRLERIREERVRPQQCSSACSSTCSSTRSSNAATRQRGSAPQPLLCLPPPTLLARCFLPRLAPGPFRPVSTKFSHAFPPCPAALATSITLNPSPQQEKARRQGPKALEKFEERLRKEEMRKAMKRRTVRMG